MAKNWSFACPDWEARLAAGRPPIPDLPLDAAAADRAVAIFNKLRLPDVPGKPLLAEACGDWFRDGIVRPLFGSIDPVTGARHVAEVFALVPKKNSKTTYTAAVALTFMLINERPLAEALTVGPTQDIADLLFAQAKGMIESDDEGYLSQRFHVQEHLKIIVDRTNNAKLRIKSFDLRVQTGGRPVAAFIDELHVMSANPAASRVLGQIRGGLLPNPESMLMTITTQSDQAPAGVFKAELAYARGVRDGRIGRDPDTGETPRVLPVLYEFSEAVQRGEGEPWRDPARWPMVLPNLGRSITIERLQAEWRTAREKGPEETRRWASQHLNVEIGMALHSDRWIGADLWPQAVGGPVTLDDLLETSDVCTVGIDGGGLDDMLGLAVIGRCAETRRWRLWAHAWVHPEALERRKEIASRLLDFAEGGELTVCERPEQDLEEAADIVARIRDAGLLPEAEGVGPDPAGIDAMLDQLATRGIDGELVKGVPQGWRLAPAIWGLERRLKDKTFLHSGSPLMAWCVGNLKVEQRGNAVSMTKAAAGKAKIDPAIAMLNAAMLMARNPVARSAARSYIEDTDLMVL